MYFTTRKGKEVQLGSAYSFVGGKPMMPKSAAFPQNKETGQPLTFFFQFLFPDDHSLSGKVALFFADLDIPRFEDAVPDRFMDTPLVVSDNDLLNFESQYQMLFFDKEDINIRADYHETIEYHEVLKTQENDSDHSKSDGEGGVYYGNYADTDRSDLLFMRLASEPFWRNEPQPIAYSGKSGPPVFLFQLCQRYFFTPLPGAPKQNDFGIHDPHKPGFVLFAGGEGYFYVMGKEKIFVICQAG